MKIKISAVTDTGKVRENNEDAFIFCQSLENPNWKLSETAAYARVGDYGSIMVVADGMGGENAGEVASSLAVNTVRRSFSAKNIENALKSEGGIDDFLCEVIHNADTAINQEMEENPDTAGMGTTIVICWIVGNMAHIAWCGDSRCYLYNLHKGIRQLTKDHSYVQELLDKGEITLEESFTHPDSNLITRGLGDFDTRSVPDIITCPLEPNDYIMLCSDGLCGFCTDDIIGRVMEKHCFDIGKCRDELLKLAMDSGGDDNVCIVLASLIGDEQSAPEPPGVFRKLWASLTVSHQ